MSPDGDAGAVEVLDLKADELDYFHRDFHAATARAVRYLDEHWGPDATEAFLRRVARNVFGELIAELRRDGLDAFERHWRKVFGREGGSYSLARAANGRELVLTVDECPVISHLKKTNQLATPRMCLTTVVVNEEICRDAGLECSCAYEPGEGRCVQRFWAPAPVGEAKP